VVQEPIGKAGKHLKGHSTSGKMNVYLKWIMSRPMYAITGHIHDQLLKLYSLYLS